MYKYSIKPRAYYYNYSYKSGRMVPDKTMAVSTISIRLSIPFFSKRWLSYM